MSELEFMKEELEVLYSAALDKMDNYTSFLEVQPDSDYVFEKRNLLRMAMRKIKENLK